MIANGRAAAATAEPTSFASYGRTRVIAFVNEKGGVAKTTSCVNLSAALAGLGYRVLCLDMDPQANASLGLGVPADKIQHEPHALLTNSRFRLDRAIVPTTVDGVDLIPSTAGLAQCNKALVPEVARETRLRAKIAAFLQRGESPRYDFMLIDCAPALDLLTVNSLTAATDLVVPVQARFYSLQGMAAVADTVATLCQQLGAEVRLLGVLVTMYNRRAAVDHAILDLLKNKMMRTFGDRLFETVVPMSAAVSETEALGPPLVVRWPNSPAARAYRSVAREMLRRMGFRTKERIASGDGAATG